MMIKKKEEEEEIHNILVFLNFFFYYKPKNETINRKLDNSLTSYNKILFLLHECSINSCF